MSSYYLDGSSSYAAATSSNNTNSSSSGHDGGLPHHNNHHRPSGGDGHGLGHDGGSYEGCTPCDPSFPGYGGCLEYCWLVNWLNIALFGAVLIPVLAHRLYATIRSGLRRWVPEKGGCILLLCLCAMRCARYVIIVAVPAETLATNTVWQFALLYLWYMPAGFMVDAYLMLLYRWAYVYSMTRTAPSSSFGGSARDSTDVVYIIAGVTVLAAFFALAIWDYTLSVSREHAGLGMLVFLCLESALVLSLLVAYLVYGVRLSRTLAPMAAVSDAGRHTYQGIRMITMLSSFSFLGILILAVLSAVFGKHVSFYTDRLVYMGILLVLIAVYTYSCRPFERTTGMQKAVLKSPAPSPKRRPSSLMEIGRRPKNSNNVSPGLQSSINEVMGGQMASTSGQGVYEGIGAYSNERPRSRPPSLNSPGAGMSGVGVVGAGGAGVQTPSADRYSERRPLITPPPGGLA